MGSVVHFAGNSQRGAGVPLIVIAVREKFRDQRGIALPLALGVTVVLSSLAAGVFVYVTSNQSAAERSRADQKAYGLAEAGLSYAFATLSSAADPYNAEAVPETTVSLSGGTVTYRGSLSGTTWTLTGVGTVANPTGPSAAPVVRTVSAQAQVTTATEPDMRPWNYLFIDQPSSCITLGNLVTLDLAIYVRGNLCMQNNSQVWSPAVHVIGSLYMNNSAQIGSSGSPISEFAATGTCHYAGTPVACGPASRVWASSIGTLPPTISKPVVDLATWYTNADLGPRSGCTTGSFPGGFDNDTTLNVSRGEINLTPSTAYDCRKVVNGVEVARLSWQPGSPGTLTVKGTIYFDGHLSWTNLNLIQYDGRATLYASGQVRIRNRADLCGVRACDNTWDPRQDLLVFVAGSLVSETSSNPLSGDIGNHVNFQGAIYAVNDLELDNNTTIWGPLITRSATISNSANLKAPPYPIDEYMLGMPAATVTLTRVEPIDGSYAG
jgi:Tfp pilus assembly protein PilX